MLQNSYQSCSENGLLTLSWLRVPFFKIGVVHGLLNLRLTLKEIPEEMVEEKGENHKQKEAAVVSTQADDKLSGSASLLGRESRG